MDEIIDKKRRSQHQQSPDSKGYETILDDLLYKSKCYESNLKRETSYISQRLQFLNNQASYQTDLVRNIKQLQA